MSDYKDKQDVDSANERLVESFRTPNIEGEMGIFELILDILTGKRDLDKLLELPDKVFPEIIKLRLVEEIRGEKEAQRRRAEKFVESLSPEEIALIEKLMNSN